LRRCEEVRSRGCPFCEVGQRPHARRHGHCQAHQRHEEQELKTSDQVPELRHLYKKTSVAHLDGFAAQAPQRAGRALRK
jgi:hypothetical protein